MSASPSQDNAYIEKRRLPRTSPYDRHFDKQPEAFKERHRQRLALEAQRDDLCAKLNQVYRDARVLERGIAELDKRLEDL